MPPQHKPERHLAMLIDGDNAQHKLIKEMLEEVSRYGTVTTRRAYGDWVQPNMANWRDTMLAHAIQPIQQWRYTNSKNATDSALIIDAMDILYSGSVQGFCIVSSDSDFTELARFLKEKRKIVIGMGEEKTPIAFSQACTKFHKFDELEEQSIEKPDEEIKSELPTFEELFIQAYENIPKKEDEIVELKQIRDEMLTLDSEFASSDLQRMPQFAERAEQLQVSYPSEILRINKESVGKAFIHNVCVKDRDVFRFITSYDRVPEKDRQSDGWVLLSVVGQILKTTYSNYQDGYTYGGSSRKKSLAKVATEMTRDYSNIIEIHEEDDGKSVIYLFRVNR